MRGLPVAATHGGTIALRRWDHVGVWLSSTNAAGELSKVSRQEAACVVANSVVSVARSDTLVVPRRVARCSAANEAVAVGDLAVHRDC
jgi:hypothetical protein